MRFSFGSAWKSFTNDEVITFSSHKLKAYRINYSGGTPMSKQLVRRDSNKIIAGVCGGLGEYFGIDPVLVRLAFVISVLMFGFGFLPYIILWILMQKR
jgi:phage shock protein PspC (stress-responsive transcriptional regulator)